METTRPMSADWKWRGTGESFSNPKVRPAPMTVVRETLQVTVQAPFAEYDDVHSQFGLPFGLDRLVLIFLATLAIRRKSQTVRYRSATEMLDTIGMANGSKEFRCIVAAFERIFGATMFFSTKSTRSTATVIHHSRFNFLRKAEIWYSRFGEAPACQNTITLSDDFDSEISCHPSPADLEAIKIPAAAPTLLDLFKWLSYRALSRRALRQFRSSLHADSRSSWAASNTLRPADSGPCTNSGC